MLPDRLLSGRLLPDPHLSCRSSRLMPFKVGVGHNRLRGEVHWLHRARQSASEGSVGIVSLLGECHEPERRGTDDGLATPGCLWSTCGQGRRAEDRSVDPLRHAITCIRWVPLTSRVRGSTYLSESSAAIDLHEIHLARQSSLQVPVGHITVPGGIKLCSPGTFSVVNYLIINNGSCQVNFMKPNRATILYTKAASA